MDVDMTVEEGVQAIVTSGVAMSESDDGLSREELNALTDATLGEDDGDSDTSDADSTATDGSDPPSPEATVGPKTRYDDQIDPANVETPQELARRERGLNRNESGATGKSDDSGESAATAEQPTEEG
ncbi:hypothetical protein [Halobellus rufus]|uniref:hypothetical protein n=1 Tax=Halobellus rufus TaxID=1448860 RepID=UPI000678AF3E|nr:hypothetical protein [Halobellus rufus]